MMRNVLLQLQIWDVQKLLSSEIDPQILRPIEQIPNESIRKFALCVGVSTFILLFVVLCMTKDYIHSYHVQRAQGSSAWRSSLQDSFLTMTYSGSYSVPIGFIEEFYYTKL
jgi:hypothetical protein